MTSDYDYILAKQEDRLHLTLSQHLQDVADIAVTIAGHVGFDKELARKAALIHDIGKVSPLFQQTLRKGYRRPPCFVWRHEIASLFFLQYFPESEWPVLTDMIAAHHKSVCNDAGDKGLVDLEDNTLDSFEHHAQGLEQWSNAATGILRELGLRIESVFSMGKARECYDFAVHHCEEKGLGYSLAKGILMAADHMASALEEKDKCLPKLFTLPDLGFYDRQNELYPLSMVDASDKRPHTLVTAPTGAGKTDFLMRRCKGRVFYILPYQASINAMYDRFVRELGNTDASISLLHSASFLKVEDGNVQESIMQRMVGASVKVLTPHQIAGVVFGIKGFEAMIADLRGCDVILDEIHTYSSEIQAIVLRIIEVLLNIGCRVHVGTATMPSVLYVKILEILGGEGNVYEVSLPKRVLDTFDRHTIHKADSLDDCLNVIGKSIRDGKKVLVVCNQVRRSQQIYGMMQDWFPETAKMLIHSRFKRGDRARLESMLTDRFSTSAEACIVVSTQVVEVSLDISFDIMITECAPIDAMIQRFGRINRKRSAETIGRYKPIYVLTPPVKEQDAKPYSLDVLRKSYDVLPDGEVLHERNLQDMIDTVYPDARFLNLDYSGVCFNDGEWTIKELCHHSKSAFLELLDINSVTCITEHDKDAYLSSSHSQAATMEIPVSYKSMAYTLLEQVTAKNRPYVIPDSAYDGDIGILTDKLRPEYYQKFEIL